MDKIHTYIHTYIYIYIYIYRRKPTMKIPLSSLNGPYAVDINDNARMRCGMD